MDIPQFVIHIPEFTLRDLTLLSIILALVGASYLAFEFLETSQQGFLRWFMQLTVPLMAALIISIPVAFLAWRLSLIPTFNGALNDIIPVNQFPYIVLIIGIFIGLFHGIFADLPSRKNGSISGETSTGDSSQPFEEDKPKWSFPGFIQGAFFGLLLGYFFTWGLETLTFIASNDFSTYSTTQFHNTANDAFDVALNIMLVGAVWRGRLHKPPAPKWKGKFWHIPVNQWHRALFISLKDRAVSFYSFYLRPIKISDEHANEEENSENQSSMQPDVSQLPFSRFSLREARVAGLFWLGVSLVAVLILIMDLTSSVSIGTQPFSASIAINFAAAIGFLVPFTAATGWFTGGFSSFACWASHRKFDGNGKKLFGYVGVALTVIAFLMQMVEPLAQQFQPLVGLPGPASVIAWSPNDTRLAIAGDPGNIGTDSTLRIQIINPETDSAVKTLYPELNNISGLIWSHDGTYLASWDDNGDVQFWNFNTNSVATSVSRIIEAGPIAAISWSPHGNLLATYQDASILQVYDLDARSLLWLDLTNRCQKDPNQPVITLSWSPNEMYLASVDDSGIVCEWKVSNGTLVKNEQSFPGDMFTNANTDLKWTTSDQSEPVGAYETIQSDYMKAGDGANHYLTAYAFKLPQNAQNGSDPNILPVWSADGKYVAVARNHTVEIWDAVHDTRLLTYRGHFDDVIAVVWSSDGSYIASGSIDGVVQLWDPQTGILFMKYGSSG